MLDVADPFRKCVAFADMIVPGARTIISHAWNVLFVA